MNNVYLKAIAISSSNLVKCEPDCLLQSSATPITSLSSLIGKHNTFLKMNQVITSYKQIVSEAHASSWSLSPDHNPCRTSGSCTRCGRWWVVQSWPRDQLSQCPGGVSPRFAETNSCCQIQNNCNHFPPLYFRQLMYFHQRLLLQVPYFSYLPGIKNTAPPENISFWDFQTRRAQTRWM